MHTLYYTMSYFTISYYITLYFVILYFSSFSSALYYIMFYSIIPYICVCTCIYPFLSRCLALYQTSGRINVTKQVRLPIKNMFSPSPSWGPWSCLGWVWPCQALCGHCGNGPFPICTWLSCYPLVNYHKFENHNFLWENSL